MSGIRIKQCNNVLIYLEENRFSIYVEFQCNVTVFKELNDSYIQLRSVIDISGSSQI